MDKKNQMKIELFKKSNCLKCHKDRKKNIEELIFRPQD